MVRAELNRHTASRTASRDVSRTESIRIKKQLTPAERKKARAEQALETKRRWRTESWRIMVAIAELVPKNADVDGCAKGNLNVNELAARVGVSKKGTIRALTHWHHWRVLWLRWQGRNIEIRFERQVLERILAAQAEPRKVGSLLVAHRKRREEVAPRHIPATEVAA